MPDIEGISDKTPRKARRFFDRFLLKPLRFGQFDLMDFHDTPSEVREAVAQIVESDPSLPSQSTYHVDIGTSMRLRFRLFVLKDGNPMMRVSYDELTGGPWGYGLGDFKVMRYVFPEFRGAAIVGLADCVIKYLGMKAGVFKRLYGFYKVAEGTVDSAVWSLVSDLTAGNLCAPAHFLDGQPGSAQIRNLTYVRTVATEKGSFVIFESRAEDLDQFTQYLRMTPLADHIDELDNVADTMIKARIGAT
jgi:hypothetical protein